MELREVKSTTTKERIVGYSRKYVKQILLNRDRRDLIGKYFNIAEG